MEGTPGSHRFALFAQGALSAYFTYELFSQLERFVPNGTYWASLTLPASAACVLALSKSDQPLTRVLMAGAVVGGLVYLSISTRKYFKELDLQYAGEKVEVCQYYRTVWGTDYKGRSISFQIPLEMPICRLVDKADQLKEPFASALAVNALCSLGLLVHALSSLRQARED